VRSTSPEPARVASQNYDGDGLGCGYMADRRRPWFKGEQGGWVAVALLLASREQECGMWNVECGMWVELCCVATRVL
jgi:hypothetical protein